MANVWERESGTLQSDEADLGRRRERSEAEVNVLYMEYVVVADRGDGGRLLIVYSQDVK